MSKLNILQDLSFGNQIAEEEKDTLKDYFVQTSSWQKILRGDIDIIYGPKGSGKSAIYVLIQDYIDQLFDRNILLVSAENIRGDPAFKSLALDPPTSEREFTNLWKLYFVTLIARALLDFHIQGPQVTKLKEILKENNLLPTKETSLGAILKAAQTYIKKITNPQAIEAGFQFDSTTGIPNRFFGKISFDDPDPEKENQGYVSLDQLFSFANKALEATKYKIWVLLDRLDVAFDETSELEKNALRALFRAYRDIRKFDAIVLKVFLRTDIWERIADQGFREATHISRDVTLRWDKSALQNLIIRRLLNNTEIIRFYNVDRKKILEDYDAQSDFFYRIFPTQVEVGEKQSSTIDWLIKRITDSRNEPAPRELIFFLNKIADRQAARLERGEDEPEGENLFDRVVFKEALPELSEYRTTKMLYAKYPEYKSYIEKLRGEKTEQTIGSLTKIWKESEELARKIASRLSEIGFFEQRGVKENPFFWVPFIYRPYLALVQGKADD